MNRFFVGGLAAIAVSLLAGTANAETLRIALHGQAGIDAFTPTAERIEATLGVDVEIVEYPAPDGDYMTKLLTELAAGNGPDPIYLKQGLYQGNGFTVEHVVYFGPAKIGTTRASVQ